MKVVVAGGSGFIGSRIVNRLAREKENRIWVITRNPTRARLRLVFPNVSFLDLSKGWDFIRGALFEIKPDAVINTVGILYEKGGNTYKKVHVDFVKNLVDISKSVFPNRFVHISACGVGRNFYSEYFRTKFKGGEIVVTSGLPYTIFRPSIVTGEEQLLLKQLKEFSKIFPLLVFPKMKVQPLYVEDLVEAVYLSLFRGDLKNRICEVGGEKVYSMGEFVKRLLDKLGIKKPVFELPWWAFIPALPFLSLIGAVGWEQLMMARTDNVCPDNCLLKILPALRDPFDF